MQSRKKEIDKEKNLQLIRFLTCLTSVKLHSHADTAIPASRDEADGLCNDWRVEYVGHYAVLVSVGLKVL